MAWQWGWDPTLAGMMGLHHALEFGEKIGNLVLFLAVAPSYLIFGTPTARTLQKAVLPRFEDDWSLRSNAIYYLITLPLVRHPTSDRRCHPSRAYDHSRPTSDAPSVCMWVG